MSEKSFNGQNLQIPSGVRWGGAGLQADVGANNCMYIFQIVDQNGDPILARQQVKMGACACTTAAGTTLGGTAITGLGPKAPTAAEIASSVLVEQANTVFITAAGTAVAVAAGSADPAGTLHLAGFIGQRGLMVSFIPETGGAGNDYKESIFETDTEGKWSVRSTDLADNHAIVITLTSGKVLYFNNVRS